MTVKAFCGHKECVETPETSEVFQCHPLEICYLICYPAFWWEDLFPDWFPESLFLSITFTSSPHGQRSVVKAAAESVEASFGGAFRKVLPCWAPPAWSSVEEQLESGTLRQAGHQEENPKHSSMESNPCQTRLDDARCTTQAPAAWYLGSFVHLSSGCSPRSAGQVLVGGALWGQPPQRPGGHRGSAGSQVTGPASRHRWQPVELNVHQLSASSKAGDWPGCVYNIYTVYWYKYTHIHIHIQYVAKRLICSQY